MSEVREITASAPVRLDFAGGWTDVPPFSAEQGGVVVSAAIGLRVHATAVVDPPGGGERVELASDDLDATVSAERAAELPAGGPLALLVAAVRRYPVGAPIRVRTRADVPPGSGLGSSGAVDVALVAALMAARGEQCDALELAHRAWQIEAADVGIPGGKQDQYAAAVGGFNLLRFADPAVEVVPLALDADTRRALESATLLCYTGRARLSGDTIARVIAAYERREPRVTAALMGIRDTADRFADVLRAGDLARIGGLLQANWTHQQALDPAMCTPEMAALERAVRAAGGLGGKAAGAGAGGCMFFVVRDRARAAAAARAAGAAVLPVIWSPEGVTTC